MLLGVAVPARAEEPVLVIEGRGWGHGVGMSQEGARTMGAGGSTTDSILATFYPGTQRGAGRGTVRVIVLESSRQAEVLAFPDGGELLAEPSGTQPPGFPIVVAPGGSVEVSHVRSGLRVTTTRDRFEESSGASLSMRLISDRGTVPPVATLPTVTTTSMTTTTLMSAETTTTGRPPVGPPATATSTPTPPPPSGSTVAPSVPTSPVNTTAPSTLSTAVSSDRLWAVPSGDGVTSVASRGRRYRGAIEVGAGPAMSINLINHVDVESYLRGMGEVLDPSWPPAALRAQAVAARTYALRATGAAYDLCDDDRCQVYIGQRAEYPAMDRAVADTRGQVLMYGGSLAATFYSANAGGVSATADEGFGPNGPSYPYLRSSAYRTADPSHWTERVRLGDAQTRLAYPGHLSGARVSATGPSGRATEVTLEGDAGPFPVDGITFASRLGLKSTLFNLKPVVGVAPDVAAPAEPSLGQDPAALTPSRSAALDGVVPVTAATLPRPWARRHTPELLLLLSVDLALLAIRRRRSRAASLHLNEAPSSLLIQPAFPPGQ